MQLRNRSIGIGSTFYPFKRLPAELRCMIWRLSPQPRVVEVGYDYTWRQDYESLDPRELAALGEDSKVFENFRERGHYTSRSAMPTSFYACKDAHIALLPLYPLCFASETHGPRVRFNLSLDILYVGSHFRYFLIRFLACFSLEEMTHLERLAINENIVRDGSDRFGNADWNDLGARIEKLTGLKDLMTVLDIRMLVLRCTDALHDEFDDPVRTLFSPSSNEKT